MSPYTKRPYDHERLVLWLIVTALVLAGVAGIGAAIRGTERPVSFLVHEHERHTYGGEVVRSKNVVHTSEGVFENTDSLFYWKFNSSDFRNRMKVNSRCTGKVVLFRVSFFSMYPNIVEVSCVP